MTTRTYKLKFDNPDLRDFHYLEIQTSLPKSVDLRKNCSPIENQGTLGSCTANALVGNLEFLELKESAPFFDLSRLFIYYNERFLESHIQDDSGATLRDGIKTLKKYGVCQESLWPYKSNLLFSKPSEEAYAQALGHRISKYERLRSLKEMKDCLASGYPFSFGIQVYESFESHKVWTTGEIPLPAPWEKYLGGHALLAVGYDDEKKIFIFRNSWGAQWGQNGYGILPYDYITRGFASDFWTIRK